MIALIFENEFRHKYFLRGFKKNVPNNQFLAPDEAVDDTPKPPINVCIFDVIFLVIFQHMIVFVVYNILTHKNARNHR